MPYLCCNCYQTWRLVYLSICGVMHRWNVWRAQYRLGCILRCNSDGKGTFSFVYYRNRFAKGCLFRSRQHVCDIRGAIFPLLSIKASTPSWMIGVLIFCIIWARQAKVATKLLASCVIFICRGRQSLKGEWVIGVALLFLISFYILYIFRPFVSKLYLFIEYKIARIILLSFRETSPSFSSGC